VLVQQIDAQRVRSPAVVSGDGGFRFRGIVLEFCFVL
jgi:hypothetical protein